MPVLETVAAVATITSVPLAAVPILKQQSALKACIGEADESLKIVCDNMDLIPNNILGSYLDLCKKYIEVRNDYLEKRASGKYGGLQWPKTMLEGREARKVLMEWARTTTDLGKKITLSAFFTKIETKATQSNTSESDPAMASMGADATSQRSETLPTGSTSMTSFETSDIGSQQLHAGYPPQYDGLVSHGTEPGHVPFPEEENVWESYVDSREGSDVKQNST